MSKEKGGAIAPLFSLGPVQDKNTLFCTLHSVDFAVYFRVLSKSVPRIKALPGQKHPRHQKWYKWVIVTSANNNYNGVNNVIKGYCHV